MRARLNRRAFVLVQHAAGDTFLRQASQLHMKGRSTRFFLVGTALVFMLTGTYAAPWRPCSLYHAPKVRIDQGCVDQGNDQRIGAKVVCGMQRELSWKSEDQPHLHTLGPPDGVHVAVAWPPYLVLNSPSANGYWHMFRVGFRYDRNWHGYIFPTAACKCLSTPLTY